MKQPYLLDKSLFQRVKKYMEENEYVDAECMTESLMETYSDFRAKKKKHFIHSVVKAHKYMSYLEGEEGKKLNGKEVDILDSNSIKKNKKGKSVEGFSKIEDEEIPEIIELPIKKSSSSFCIDGLYRQSPTTPRASLSKHSDDAPEILMSTKKKRKRVFLSDDKLQQTDLNKSKRKKFESLIPEASFQDMKGIDSLSEKYCLLGLNLLESGWNVAATKFVLITGPEGSGKTMFITCLAGDIKAKLMRVPASKLNVGPSSEGANLVKEVFKEALSIAPCILLLEDFDQLASSEHNGSIRTQDKKICNQIHSSLTEIETSHSDKRILVVGETRNTQNIDQNLRSKFKKEIFIPAPNKKSRVDILKVFCSNVEPDFDFDDIALRTPSFVAGDLKNLTEEASQIAIQRLVKASLGKKAFKDPKNIFNDYPSFTKEKTFEITKSDFLRALSVVTPTLKSEGFPLVPDTTWDDVGGLEDVKAELAEKILRPIQYRRLHLEFRANKPNGIVMWGPPGCGKTLLAKALANHAGINLCAVSGPELLNMYQGESERAIREVFKRASGVAPCVIFLDEFESICPRRSGVSDSGSKVTIVNTLLSELNGFNQRKDIYVIAATNLPEFLDPAILRPERFDTSIYVGLPDQNGRVAVLKASVKNGTHPILAADVDLTEIASWCENFSGADCSHLVHIASMKAIKEVIATGRTGEEEDENDDIKAGTLYKKHFVEAIKRVSPSVSLEEQKKYMRMKSTFEKSIKKEVNLQDGVE